jgi:predicted GIY-YIG superfamily endonuclease
MNRKRKTRLPSALKTHKKRKRTRRAKRADPDRKLRENPKGQRSYVYFLQGMSTLSLSEDEIPKQTILYTGFSVDPAHRQREHSQEIKGGANRTKWTKNHQILFMMGASSTWFQQSVAQMLEWRCTHLNKFPSVYTPKMLRGPKMGPFPRRWFTIATKICKTLNMMAASKKWTRRAPQYDPTKHKMRYYAHPCIIKAFPKLKDHVEALPRWSGTLEPLQLETGNYAELEKHNDDVASSIKRATSAKDEKTSSFVASVSLESDKEHDDDQEEQDEVGEDEGEDEEDEDEDEEEDDEDPGREENDEKQSSS